MLATIVQLDPIYVNFNVNEQDVLRIRAEIRKRGLTPADLKKVPVEVGLQTEEGYPHKGHLDYASPTVDSSTGTLAVRADAGKSQAACCCPACSCACACRPASWTTRCWCRRRRSAPTRAGAICCMVGKDDVVEQRSVTVGRARRHHAGDREGPQTRRPRDRRRPPARGARAEGRAADGEAVAGEELTARAPCSPNSSSSGPVLANVIAILIVVIGAVAIYALPVAQYPDVVPPTVQVTTRYPGASARTVIDTVALPIEQQVNGVEGMIYMQSYAAADGSYSLTVTFKIGTDLNFAQVLVQNRVPAALSSLPDAVQAQGVVVQKKSTSILQIVTLTSPDKRYDSLYLANYATINLKDEISRLPGVGNVVVFGAGQYAMRVWLDPQKMKARGLNVQDVINALQQQNEQVTAGQIGAPPAPANVPFQYTLNVAGRLDSAAQFANVIVKTGSNGEITRVRDIGHVELGAQTYGQIFTLDGRPAAGLAVFLAPGANALDVATEVKTRMTALGAAFPHGLVYDIPFDTTVFVKASIDEVYKTLFEAAILVLIVILVFLQDWRAMLVPATTVPVTIIGAFAAMWALGFTVNFATLFAIVLAIGIVVDDAIIVVEGAAHNIDHGHERAAGGDRRHADAVRADRRHHAGAAGGVPAGRLPARPDRPDVRAIRAGDRRHRADQRDQRGDAEADAMRAVAAADGAGGEAQLLLPRLRRRLQHGRARLCRADAPPGRHRRPHGDRWRSSIIGVTLLRVHPHPDRLHPDRGPGLHAGDRAVAGRRLARAHPEGARPASSERRARRRRRRQGHHHRRRLGARQQRLARQCRHRLYHPQGLGGARQERGPAADARQASTRR